MAKCDHNHYYVFEDQPLCLHQLFKRNMVGAITRITRNGKTEFAIWRYNIPRYTKGKLAGMYNLNGRRAKLFDREQVIFAVEMANKKKIQRIKL